MAFICPRDVVFVVSWTNIPNNHQIIWKFAGKYLFLQRQIKVLTEFFDSLTDQKKPWQGVAFICVHSPVRQQRKGRRETVQGRGATSSGSDEESVCY
ncbi:MAG: hypothetical protein J6M15_09995 [Prevotella sp.]|nr:hypothetical protein [Prevotella sp.]